MFGNPRPNSSNHRPRSPQGDWEVNGNFSRTHVGIGEHEFDEFSFVLIAYSGHDALQN